MRACVALSNSREGEIMDERMKKAMEAAAQHVAHDPHLAELRKQAEAMEAAGLSTDGPTPPPCDPKILREGERVFVTSTIPSNAMEGWVKHETTASHCIQFRQ